MRINALLSILLMLLVVANLPAKARRNSDGVSLGLKGGAGVAWQTTGTERLTTSTGMLFGFHLGALARLPLHKYVEAEANLTFSRKGAGSEWGSYSLYYFNLPIYLNGVMPINREVNAFVGLGPTFSVAVAGSVSAGGESVATDFATTERLDIALAAQAGLRFNRIQVSAYLDYGLYNIDKAPEAPKSTGNPLADELAESLRQAFNIRRVTKNRGLGISISYTF